MGTGDCLESKAEEIVKLTTQTPSRPEVKDGGAMPPLPHASSWRGD